MLVGVINSKNVRNHYRDIAHEFGLKVALRTWIAARKKGQYRFTEIAMQWPKENKLRKKEY